MHPQEENPYSEKTKNGFQSLHTMWELDTIACLDCSNNLFLPTIYYWSDKVPINVS